jgi:hypothetical protein
MTFEDLLDQAIALLQRRGRVTYRTLKRQFELHDDVLEDLKEELIYGQRLAVEAGIGKSRLVQVLKEHVAAEPQARLTPCQCSPYYQHTALYPLPTGDAAAGDVPLQARPDPGGSLSVLAAEYPAAVPSAHRAGD